MPEEGNYVGDLDEIRQDDEFTALPSPTFNVNVDGPVQVHTVPRQSGGSRSFALLATAEPRRVGNDDPRRASLVLMSDQPFYFGEDANQVTSRYGGWWPANVPCNITHQDAVYVQLTTDGTLTSVTENWAS